MATFVGADAENFRELNAAATGTLDSIKASVENGDDAFHVLDGLVAETRSRYAAPGISIYDVLLAAFRLGQGNPSVTVPAAPVAPAPDADTTAEPAA